MIRGWAQRWAMRRLGLRAVSVAATVAITAAACALPGVHAQTRQALQTLSHGRFHGVHVLRPAGEPNGIVLYLSSEHGMTRTDHEEVNALVAQGALVATIDGRQLMASLATDGDCTFPEGDLDNLGRFIQAYEKLPNYTPPILVGESATGTLAYALVALGLKGTFAGAISRDFCPVLPLRVPLCKGAGTQYTWNKAHTLMTFTPTPSLRAPWTVIQGAPARAPRGVPAAACADDAIRQFVARVPGAQFTRLTHDDHATASPQARMTALKAAYEVMRARRTAASTPPPPAAVSDLPVVEVPAAPGAPASDELAIFISGDGGWAGIDKDVGAALAKAGVPVVGVDSLRYFWTARTPARTAADIDRLIRFYTAHWKKSKVLLVGYSQGADVMPFVVNRLPAASRAQVALAVMMGLGERADFEFHMSHWLSSSTDGLLIAPEARRLPAGMGLCIYGEEDTDSTCPKLDARRVKVIKLSGGHHFGGDYSHLAKLILEAARAHS